MPFLKCTSRWGSRWRQPDDDEQRGSNGAAQPTESKPVEKQARSKKEERLPSTDMLLDGIGDYIYEEQLGHGKFAKVHLARHYLTEDLYAIKIIDKRSHDKRVMSRLAREIALMEVLEHKNVVRLCQTYETAETMYLVMEYVPGWNLDEYLQSQPEGFIKEPEARHIFRQMVEALDYCHSRWVVHRDLKAPNILLTPQGDVKLADFGLGNRYGLRRLVTICGSMLYYSPEIISGTKYMGPEVDCWCLGVTLFRMTAGYEPFAHARTVSELKRDVIQGDYKRPAHISQGLWNTIRKCMHSDKKYRVDLKTALTGDPWLNNFGELPDLFVDPSQRENRYQGQRPYPVVQKRVIYHPHVDSIYYTKSTEEDPAKDVMTAPAFEKESGQEAVDASRGLLLGQIIADLQMFDLQPTTHISDIQSPIQHLWRKLKRPESLPPSNASQIGRPRSAHNLSQLYNRVAKDQIKYYVLSDVRSRSPESGVVLDMHNGWSRTGLEQDPMQIIRRICDMLGITYRHESKSRLHCVFTIRNFVDKKKTWRYSLRGSQDGSRRWSVDASTTPRAANEGARKPTCMSTDTITTAATTTIEAGRQNSSFISRQSSGSRPNIPRRWSRQLKRLSIPLHSIGSHSFHLHSSTPLYHYQDGSAGGERASHMPEKTGETIADKSAETIEPSAAEGEKKEKTAVFTIEVSLCQSSKDVSDKLVMAIRYSKIKGSSKAFKVATGWIHTTHFCKDYRATTDGF